MQLWSCRLILLGFYLLVWVCSVVVPADAAAPPPPLVAVILPRDNARFQSIHVAFLKHFEKVVSAGGKPRLYVQSPNADVMSLRNSIRKATALGADLTVVYGTRAAKAAKQEDFTDPLIFADVFEPVAMGLVPSLERGDMLVTGVIGHAPSQTLFKMFQDTTSVSHIAVPVEPKYPAGAKQIDVLRNMICRGSSAESNGSSNKSADRCRPNLVSTEIRSVTDVSKALGAVSENIGAIFISDLLPSDAHVAETIRYATQAGLPVISQLPGSADMGAFMTLEADPEEQGRLLAEIADRVIGGDLPEDIPPKLPRKVSLVVNLNVAKDLGIHVPFSVLTQVNRVIR